ncbi:MAG: dihydropteroate synthase [Thermoleophilia bacterium]
MLVIGERINTTRAGLHDAVEAREAGPLTAEALAQRDAGAHLLDVNCGSVKEADEPDALAWLVQTVQEAVDLPLCIDSANPAALAAGLAVHKGRPFINSISGESGRYRAVLPLVIEYQASVVALGMDDRGIPGDRERSIEVGAALVERLVNDGVPLENVYFDPLVRSLSTSPTSIPESLELIEQMGCRLPGLHFVSGLSNVSYGLPERRHVNRAFAVLGIASGLDAMIVDPLDQTLMALIYAAEALAGRDRFCLEYIKAYKAGRLAV